MNIKRLLILAGTVLLGLTLVSMWILFLSAPLESALAASYTVCLAGPPTCNYSSIQAAIDAAGTDDTLELAGETFTETITVDKSLTISGVGAESTIVQAAVAPGIATSRVITIPYGVTVTVTGLTIRHGKLEGCGGIHNNGDLTISQTIIKENQALLWGGGICNSGTMTITNSIISENQSGDGGGIPGNGGGILNSGNLSLINSTISNNFTGAHGGGIISTGGNVSLDNVTISNNSGGSGGGISIASGNITITNSTITNNSAGDGGGIAASVNIAIMNSIIAGNFDTGDNLQPDCSAGEGVIVSYGYNLVGVVDGCNWVDATGDLTGTLAAPLDPVIGPLQDNGGPTLTHALLPESPAIDSGSCPDFTADQRGYPRPVDILAISDADDGCDIGAFEIQNLPPTINGVQSGQTVDDDATIDPFTGVTISDPDYDTLTVIVSLDNDAKGDLTNLGGFVEGPAGTYTYMGSPAASTTALRDLSFVPTEGRLPVGETETTTFTISADDGTADPVTDDTTTVIVTAVEESKKLFLPLILR